MTDQVKTGVFILESPSEFVPVVPMHFNWHAVEVALPTPDIPVDDVADDGGDDVPTDVPTDVPAIIGDINGTDGVVDTFSLVSTKGEDFSTIESAIFTGFKHGEDVIQLDGAVLDGDLTLGARLAYADGDLSYDTTGEGDWTMLAYFDGSPAITADDFRII